MARELLSLDYEGVDDLAAIIENYDGYAGNAINDVLWNDGFVLISESITGLLPVSQRRWAGKKPAAKQSKPFIQINEPLSVTVKTKNAYGYLYFPDDGSNTYRHAGNQAFMIRGAEAQQDEVTARVIERLVRPFK